MRATKGGRGIDEGRPPEPQDGEEDTEGGDGGDEEGPPGVHPDHPFAQLLPHEAAPRGRIVPDEEEEEPDGEEVYLEEDGTEGVRVVPDHVVEKRRRATKRRERMFSKRMVRSMNRIWWKRYGG